MDITPLIPEGQQIIQRYSAGMFRVSGQTFKGSIIVSPTRTTTWAGPESFAVLEERNFDALAEFAGAVDVVLLGAGNNGGFMPPSLRSALKAKGLSMDVMDTGAACRTYNVLMAEGRRVVAALLPVN